MSAEHNDQILRFRHGSRAMLLVGAILLVSGVVLIYTAFSDAESSAGVSVYNAIVGIIVLLTGAKLAFGLERNEFNIATRRWRSMRGLLKRKIEEGTFDDLEAVMLDHQVRRHGIERFDTYHIAVRRTDGYELHIDQSSTMAYASALAHELAMRLGVKVEEHSDEHDEEEGADQVLP